MLVASVLCEKLHETDPELLTKDAVDDEVDGAIEGDEQVVSLG